MVVLFKKKNMVRVDVIPTLDFINMIRNALLMPILKNGWLQRLKMTL